MKGHYVTPCGDKIKGTLEMVSATAEFESRYEQLDPENPQCTYSGNNDIHWNTTETVSNNDGIVFVCEKGHEWSLNQLTFVPDTGE